MSADAPNGQAHLKIRNAGARMAFRYSCFISYRHVPGDKEIIEDLYQAIADELANYVSKEVFRDTESLEGGDFLNKRLARALCESACMIVFYVPVYFDERFTFCAREYCAMELLEQKRIKQLQLFFDDPARGD